MLTKTSIILFLMLIAFTPDGEGFEEGSVRSAEMWSSRMPSRLLQSRNVTIRRAIVNGTPADIKDYPFKVSLRLFGELFCGGSIISQHWVLTAGFFLLQKRVLNNWTIASFTAHCLEYMWLPEWVNEISFAVEKSVMGCFSISDNDLWRKQQSSVRRRWVWRWKLRDSSWVQPNHSGNVKNGCKCLQATLLIRNKLMC